MLLKHGTSWIYHFPNEQLVSINHPQGDNWVTHKKVLVEAGTIHHAAACSITSNEVRTLSGLQGTTSSQLDPPVFYFPDLAPILATRETPQMEDAVPVDTREIENIKSRFETPPRSFDVDALLNIYYISRRNENHFGTLPLSQLRAPPSPY
jgi:hypothetical protein